MLPAKLDWTLNKHEPRKGLFHHPLPDFPSIKMLVCISQPSAPLSWQAEASVGTFLFYFSNEVSWTEHLSNAVTCTSHYRHHSSSCRLIVNDILSLGHISQTLTCLCSFLLVSYTSTFLLRVIIPNLENSQLFQEVRLL